MDARGGVLELLGVQTVVEGEVRVRTLAVVVMVELEPGARGGDVLLLGLLHGPHPLGPVLQLLCRPLQLLLVRQHPGGLHSCAEAALVATELTVLPRGRGDAASCVGHAEVAVVLGHGAAEEGAAAEAGDAAVVDVVGCSVAAHMTGEEGRGAAAAGAPGAGLGGLLGVAAAHFLVLTLLLLELELLAVMLMQVLPHYEGERRGLLHLWCLHDEVASPAGVGGGGGGGGRGRSHRRTLHQHQREPCVLRARAVVETLMLLLLLLPVL